jgi:hypothetical protein
MLRALLDHKYLRWNAAATACGAAAAVSASYGIVGALRLVEGNDDASRLYAMRDVVGSGSGLIASSRLGDAVERDPATALRVATVTLAGATALESGLALCDSMGVAHLAGVMGVATVAKTFAFIGAGSVNMAYVTRCVPAKQPQWYAHAAAIQGSAATLGTAVGMAAAACVPDPTARVAMVVSPLLTLQVACAARAARAVGDSVASHNHTP